MAKIVPMTKGLFALVDDEDYELVSKYKWGNLTGYARTTIAGKVTLMHRLIMNAPPDREVDHINGERADNRKENLRLATRRQNGRNVKKHGGVSQYKGVCYDKTNDAWSAQITCDYKCECRHFKSELVAAVAYDWMCREKFGEYAKPNFSDETFALLWQEYGDFVTNPKRRDGYSKYRGVALDTRDGRWQSQLNLDGKHYSLGRFATEEEAARARDVKAVELLGDKARLNFPGEPLQPHLLNKVEALKSSKKCGQYVGVQPRNGKWIAQVRHNGVIHRCGTFVDEKEAAIARDKKSIELFGDKAKLNFPT